MSKHTTCYYSQNSEFTFQASVTVNTHTHTHVHMHTAGYLTPPSSTKACEKEVQVFSHWISLLGGMTRTKTLINILPLHASSGEWETLEGLIMSSTRWLAHTKSLSATEHLLGLSIFIELHYNSLHFSHIEVTGKCHPRRGH